MIHPVKPNAVVRLRDEDARPSRKLPGGDRRDRELETLRERLTAFQSVLYAEEKRSVLVVLQGRDASGKDGVIRKVFTAFNPQGCTVTSFKAPAGAELRHDYLWRVHAAVPARGTIGVFNRSHYEDLLVPRVHRTVDEDAWERRFQQINDFERMLVENGTTIVKFMLHVSRDEQKRRLQKRLDDPEKNWKFDAHDLEERALWDAYTEAYQAVLARCSTEWAPWYVVPSDKNSGRDLVVARVLADVARRMAPEYPAADEAVLASAAAIE